MVEHQKYIGYKWRMSLLSGFPCKKKPSWLSGWCIVDGEKVEDHMFEAAPILVPLEVNCSRELAVHW